MTHKEFSRVNEIAIVKNLVQFVFKRLSEHSFLIEVDIATLKERTEDFEIHEWIEATRVVTETEACCAYNNILNGGLK